MHPHTLHLPHPPCILPTPIPAPRARRRASPSLHAPCPPLSLIARRIASPHSLIARLIASLSHCTPPCLADANLMSSFHLSLVASHLPLTPLHPRLLLLLSLTSPLSRLLSLSLSLSLVCVCVCVRACLLARVCGGTGRRRRRSRRAERCCGYSWARRATALLACPLRSPPRQASSPRYALVPRRSWGSGLRVWGWVFGVGCGGSGMGVVGVISIVYRV